MFIIKTTIVVLVHIVITQATVLWTNKWRSSSKCKADCIDMGHVYCSDELNGSRDGVCCDTTEGCAQTPESFCSSETSSVGLAF